MLSHMFKRFLKLTLIGYLASSTYVYITLVNFWTKVAEYKEPLYVALPKVFAGSMMMAGLMLPMVMVIAAAVVGMDRPQMKESDRNEDT